MKPALPTIILLATLSAPASAGTCDADLAALKSQIASGTLQPDVRAQIEDMVLHAEKFCAEGNEQQAADVIADATSVLAGQ